MFCYYTCSHLLYFYGEKHFLCLMPIKYLYCCIVFVYYNLQIKLYGDFSMISTTGFHKSYEPIHEKTWRRGLRSRNNQTSVFRHSFGYRNKARVCFFYSYYFSFYRSSLPNIFKIEKKKKKKKISILFLYFPPTHASSVPEFILSFLLQPTFSDSNW